MPQPKRHAQPLAKPAHVGKPQTARLAPQHSAKAQPTARLAVPPSPFDPEPVVDTNAPTAAVVRHETRVERTPESEIDTQLRSLTKRTSLEELARAGKTRNLKTLSERDLKEWIKEALRRVISSSTTIGAADQEQLLANTRTELTAIMAERQAEASARIDDARKLAEIADERDVLARRLAALEAAGSGRVAELQRQLAEAGGRRDTLAARVADLESQLAGAVSRADLTSATPIVDEEVLVSMRTALAVAREGQAAAEAERNQLQRSLSRRLVASAEVVAALLALDRRFYNATHHHGAMESSIDAEAEFYADETAANQVVIALGKDLTALHERIADAVPDIHEGADGALPADHQRLAQMEWIQVNDSLVDDLQRQLVEAQVKTTVSPADAETMAELRTRVIDRDDQIAKLGSERDEAQRIAILARETVARLLREQDRAVAEKGTITSRIAAADRRQADADKRLANAEKRTSESEIKLVAANQVVEHLAATLRDAATTQLRNAQAAHDRLVADLAQVQTTADAVKQRAVNPG